MARIAELDVFHDLKNYRGSVHDLYATAGRTWRSFLYRTCGRWATLEKPELFASLPRVRIFREDPFGQQLTTAIWASQARGAVAVRFALRMLRREGACVVQSDALVPTGPDTRALHMTSFHKVTAERAIACSDLVAPEDRDISCLTLNVGRDALSRINDLLRIKRRPRRLRREPPDLSLLQADPRGLIQLNFQRFALSIGVKKAGDA